MYAQLTYFDGPRSPELITASNRAGRERIEPAIFARADLRDDMVAMYELQQPDGGQLIVVIVEHEESLDKAVEVIMSTELLPGEDPALLQDPDRVERFEVVRALGAQMSATPEHAGQGARR